MFQDALHTPCDAQADGTATALDKELAGSRFCDARLGRRFRTLVAQLASRLGQPIPLVCQDWTNTEAAYRFLSSGRVNEAAILTGHFQATKERFQAAEGPVLVLHDTTEFSYTRESRRAIGMRHNAFVGRDKDGKPRLHTICGILMLSSLAVTVEGLPLAARGRSSDFSAPRRVRRFTCGQPAELRNHAAKLSRRSSVAHSAA